MGQLSVLDINKFAGPHFNSLAPVGLEWNFRQVIFKLILVMAEVYRKKNILKWMLLKHIDGIKPLPEPLLTQIYVTIWRHLATMR